MINGVVAEHVHVMDRGLAYGDGVFETLLCLSGKLQFWQQHIERMHAGAEKLKITFPQPELFLSDIKQLYQAADITNCVIKLLLTRGISGRGYKYNKNIQLTNKYTCAMFILIKQKNDSVSTMNLVQRT